MKTLKKSLALLLSALMLFSTFAFVIANAEDENTRVTLDIRLDAPTAGKKAPEILPIEDKRFVPGDSELIYLLDGHPENLYKEYGKVPTVDEYMAGCAKHLEGAKEEKAAMALLALYTQVVKNGIAWVEYEEADIQALIDSGTISKEDYSRLSADYGAAPCLSYLMYASKVYGQSIKGKDGKEYTTSARCMEPGESFKAGKSYFCICVAIPDVKKETDELKKATEALMPYYEKKAVIDKKLETATGEEADKLENDLASLGEEYKDKYRDYDAKFTTAFAKLSKTAGGGAYAPEITVNTRKTAPDYNNFWASVYDFGAAGTIFDRIIEFFTDLFDVNFFRIVEFFRNLFSSFKF